jgi:hypothetical protein
MSSLREVGDASDCVILPEESICLKIVEDAEGWMAKVKKISMTNAVVKGTTMELVKELHLEGRSIPLNLDYEMRPLKTALEGVRGWLTEHHRVLSLLGVTDGGVIYDSNGSSSSSRRDVDESTEPGGEDTERNDSGVLSSQSHSSASEESVFVTYEELFYCANAANQLSLDFDEVRVVRKKLQLVDDWLLEVKERCDRCVPKTVSTSSKQDLSGNGDSSELQSVGVAGKRRKGQGKDKASSSLMTGEDEKDKSSRSSMKSLGLTSSMSTKVALLSLLTTGRGLGLQVPKEVALIEETLAAIDLWDTQTSSTVQSLDASLLAPLTTTSLKEGLLSSLSSLPFPCATKLLDKVIENTMWKGVLAFRSHLHKLRDQAVSLGTTMHFLNKLFELISSGYYSCDYKEKQQR